MAYALKFTLFTIALGWLAIHHGGAAYLLLWPAVSFLAVAVAYATGDSRVFGKKASGDRALWATLLLLPYLAFSWAVWTLNRCVSGEACHDLVAPGIWLGRRPYCREVPPDVTCIIDLACEFTPARGIHDGREYISLPVLDACTPPADVLLATATRAASHKGGIYVNCAAGHGRSAMFVAALLLVRGLAKTAAEATELVHGARPAISLSPSQQKLLIELEGKLRR